MEDKKQKAIREAYFEEFRISGTKEEDLKERFDAIRCALDYSGWFEGKLYNIDITRFDSSGHEVRPTSLFGLENNNGWFDFNDEPKGAFAYFVIFDKNLMVVAHWDNDKKEFYSENLDLKNVSKYKLIEVPPKPLY